MRISDILILGIILGGFFFYYFSKKIKSIRIKKTLAGAKKAERDAISFLNNEGYKIVDIQQKQPIVLYIDGKPYSSYVQVDFIVKKNRKKYIVEVKTGKKTRATTALVRRQLLEYYLVFNPQGILLLDMDKGTLKRIEFEWGKPTYSWYGFIIAGLLGALFGIMLWRFLG